MPIINVNKVKLNYKVLGKGPELVFLHGGCLDTRAYSKLLSILSKSFKVYGIDLPHHGKSSKLQNYFIEVVASLIQGFTKKLKIKNPYVFGQSAGSIIAIYYAAHSKNIKKLILSAPPGLEYYKNPNIFILKLFFVHPFVSFIVSPIRSLLMAYVALTNILRNLFNKNYFSAIKKEVSREHKALENIKTKTLILWPKHDIFFPVKLSKKFALKIPNSELIIVNATHEWLTLRPNKIKNLIQELKK